MTLINKYKMNEGPKQDFPCALSILQIDATVQISLGAANSTLMCTG
jgi:hypothetical protein